MNKHFILTHGRSGSNYIANTLNRHPNLVNYGEVLGQWTLPYKLHRAVGLFGNMGWEGYLDWMYRSVPFHYAGQAYSAIHHYMNKKTIQFKARKNVSSVGMKDFAFLLEKRNLLDYLVDRKDIKVIYLFRSNQFKRYLSLLNMRATGVVKSESGARAARKMRIDIADMLENLHRYEGETRIGDNIVARIEPERLMTISYDEYFSDGGNMDRINRSLFGFLNVAEIEIKSNQQKILSDDLRDLIENFDEVSEAMQQNGFGAFLG